MTPPTPDGAASHAREGVTGNMANGNLYAHSCFSPPRIPELFMNNLLSLLTKNSPANEPAQEQHPSQPGRHVWSTQTPAPGLLFPCGQSCFPKLGQRNPLLHLRPCGLAVPLTECTYPHTHFSPWPSICLFIHLKNHETIGACVPLPV